MHPLISEVFGAFSLRNSGHENHLISIEKINTKFAQKEVQCKWNSEIIALKAQ